MGDDYRTEEGRPLSDERPRVDPGKLTRFSIEALQKLGVPSDDAGITARMLVACDL